MQPFYKKLVQTYVDINKAAQAAGKTGPITSLSIWGLFDAPYLSTADYSYKMNGPYCGLFTELYQPKQSFKEVYEVLAAEKEEKKVQQLPGDLLDLLSECEIN